MINNIQTVICRRHLEHSKIERLTCDIAHQWVESKGIDISPSSITSSQIFFNINTHQHQQTNKNKTSIFCNISKNFHLNQVVQIWICIKFRLDFLLILFLFASHDQKYWNSDSSMAPQAQQNWEVDLGYCISMSGIKGHVHITYLTKIKLIN